MNKPTIFERELLAAAVTALGTTGLAMVPADMVNAVWQTFEGQNPGWTCEAGVVGRSLADPAQVRFLFDKPNGAQMTCWVRCPKVVAQLRKREGVEVESRAHWRELLREYRRAGLEHGDEISLMRYVHNWNGRGNDPWNELHLVEQHRLVKLRDKGDLN